MNEPELSRWWRYDALTSTDEIRSDIVEIEGDVYKYITKLRADLAKRGLQFVQAKPVAEAEVVILKRLYTVKKLHHNMTRQPLGKQYRPVNLTVAFWSALIPIILVLIYFYFR